VRATVRACVRATVRACDRAIGARERGVECGARDEDTKRSVAPHHDDAGVTPVFRGTCKKKSQTSSCSVREHETVWCTGTGTYKE
jgi:hypothetical protein